MPDLRIVTALPQSLRPAYEALLASAGLRDEGDADCTALLSSGGGALLACGSVSGRVLKQIAVAPWAEGDGACARIITALLEESARRVLTTSWLTSTNLRDFTTQDMSGNPKGFPLLFYLFFEIGRAHV